MMTATSVSKVLAKRFTRAEFIRSGSVSRAGFSVRKLGDYTLVIDCNFIARTYSDETVVPELEAYAAALSDCGITSVIRKQFNVARLYVASEEAR